MRCTSKAVSCIVDCVTVGWQEMLLHKKIATHQHQEKAANREGAGRARGHGEDQH